MTAHESTNAHGDAHAAALARSRRRAALAAWDAAVAEWRDDGEPRGDDERGYVGLEWSWMVAAYQRYGVTVVYDIATPAFVAEGR